MRGQRTFAEERAGSDDAEPDPQAPDNTTEESDNLMTEERREGDDNENADGNKPAGGEVADLFGPWAQFLGMMMSVPCQNIRRVRTNEAIN